MFSPGFDPIWYTTQRHKELLSEAQRQRLVNEAHKAGQPKRQTSSKVLAYIGKKLATLGASLEERYDVQPKSEVSLKRQGMASGS